MKITATVLLALGLGAPAAFAQQPPVPEPVKPRVWALISAVGDQITWVRQKRNVGSHLEPFQRFNIKVPDSTIDASVLKGIETVVLANDPTAERVYMRLNPAELTGVTSYKRGDVAIGKLASVLDKMPERKSWYRIVVVTPNYVGAERDRMGSKLHGIGFYVNNIARALDNDDSMGALDDGVVTPEGKETRGQQFIAPFFYARVWVIDPVTMEVLETSDRYDYQRIHDPEATALDVEKAIPPAKLGPIMDRFVQNAAARVLKDAIGVVTVTEPKVVDEKKAK